MILQISLSIYTCLDTISLKMEKDSLVAGWYKIGILVSGSQGWINTIFQNLEQATFVYYVFFEIENFLLLQEQIENAKASSTEQHDSEEDEFEEYIEQALVKEYEIVKVQYYFSRALNIYTIEPIQYIWV